MVLKLGFETMRRALSGWRVRDRAAARPSAMTAIQPTEIVRGQPQTDQEMWFKISGLMSGVARSAALTGQLQRSAGLQLDAASYALDILKFELSAAMQLTAAPALQPAVVQLHRSLRPKPPRQLVAA